MSDKNLQFIRTLATNARAAGTMPASRIILGAAADAERRHGTARAAQAVIDVWLSIAATAASNGWVDRAAVLAVLDDGRARFLSCLDGKTGPGAAAFVADVPPPLPAGASVGPVTVTAGETPADPVVTEAAQRAIAVAEELAPLLEPMIEGHGFMAVLDGLATVMGAIMMGAPPEVRETSAIGLRALAAELEDRAPATARRISAKAGHA